MELTAGQKEFYKENGYIQLSNIFTPEEIKEISDAYDSVFKRKAEQNFNMQTSWEGKWIKEAGIQSERKTVTFI